MALDIQLEPQDGQWTLVLSGELDYSECASFRMTIDRILKSSPKSTIVDLSRLDYLDSSGLGLLLSLSKEYGASGGRLVLVTNDAVDNILDLTRLSGIFSTVSSLEEAQQMLADTSVG
ncbi:MAG: STAS domain-containing protein [Coriobacteriales bacterium]|nr:STAS domain-containing protein [Actinomycetes bacterium]